jgi:hypothetical protein
VVPIGFSSIQPEEFRHLEEENHRNRCLAGGEIFKRKKMAGFETPLIASLLTVRAGYNYAEGRRNGCG